MKECEICRNCGRPIRRDDSTTDERWVHEAYPWSCFCGQEMGSGTANTPLVFDCTAIPKDGTP